MIYDNTDKVEYGSGERGYAIHSHVEENHMVYELYTDDGRGNGNFICNASELYWIRRIAEGLDMQDCDGDKFDYEGIRK